MVRAIKLCDRVCLLVRGRDGYEEHRDFLYLEYMQPQRAWDAMHRMAQERLSDPSLRFNQVRRVPKEEQVYEMRLDAPGSDRVEATVRFHGHHMDEITQHAWRVCITDTLGNEFRVVASNEPLVSLERLLGCHPAQVVDGESGRFYDCLNLTRDVRRRLFVSPEPTIPEWRDWVLTEETYAIEDPPTTCEEWITDPPGKIQSFHEQRHCEGVCLVAHGTDGTHHHFHVRAAQTHMHAMAEVGRITTLLRPWIHEPSATVTTTKPAAKYTSRRNKVGIKGLTDDTAQKRFHVIYRHPTTGKPKTKIFSYKNRRYEDAIIAAASFARGVAR